jgi:A/G-specific adenine glycosylase
MKEEFAQLLLTWYKDNARSLPWRGLSDPYAIWVSEIMLLQTRVETVIPYFLKWMRCFPDIRSLSQADENEVLKQWEGLGYYSRARSMLKTARIVVEKFDGKIPGDSEKLQHLPGIGPYAAAAIASIAFGQNEAVLDGNVKRVLARVINYTKPVNSTTAENELRATAQSLLPPGQAGDFNQALMDLGATICTPRSPKCTVCPLRTVCSALKLNLVDKLPLKAPKPPIPSLEVTAAILRQDDQVLIARRPPNGLLGGLWEFPGGKVEKGEDHSRALTREIEEELGSRITVNKLFGVYKHAYTHFKVTLFAYFCTLNGARPQPLQASDIRWVNLAELDRFPMGKIDRMISRDLQNEQPGR